MLKVILKTTDGKSLGAMDFPQNAREVRLKDFIRFEVASEALEKWMEENKGALVSDPAYQAGYILHVFRCVKAFCGDDRIDKIPNGNYIGYLSGLMGAKPADLDMKEIEGTVFSLYANIFRVVQKFEKHYEKGDLYTFRYKGETYSLKRSYRDVVTQQVRFESLTTAQTVEALEAMRIYQAAAKDDHAKAYLFTTILNLTACLALTEGEAFPETDGEIERWTSERIRHFEDLDMETGLNVLDFFFDTPKRARKTRRTSIFSSLPGRFRKTRRKARPFQSGR